MKKKSSLLHQSYTETTATVSSSIIRGLALSLHIRGLGHLPEFHYKCNAVVLFFLFNINLITIFRFSFSEGVEIRGIHNLFLARELHLILLLPIQRIYRPLFKKKKKLPRSNSAVTMLTRVQCHLNLQMFGTISKLLA